MDITGLGSIFDFGSKVIERIWPDKTKQEEAKQALALAQINGQMKELEQIWDNAKAQIEVNKVEAANASLFVSGWRPGVGWVCGLGLFYVSLLEPIARFIAQVGFDYNGAFPAIDTSITMQVLLGMLGLAGMRSFDKKNGVAAK